MNVHISKLGLVLVIADNTMNQSAFMRFAERFERT